MPAKMLVEILATRTLLGDADPEATLSLQGQSSASGFAALAEAASLFCEAGADCLFFAAPPEPDKGVELVRGLREIAGPERYLAARLPNVLPGELEQVCKALAGAGTDAFLLSAGGAADTGAAVAAARSGGVPVFAEFVFLRTSAAVPGHLPYATSAGVKPEDAAERAEQWGADAVAVVGGAGTVPENLIELVAAIRARTSMPLAAFLPAGPVEGPPLHVSSPDMPEMVAQHAWPLVRSGANLLAGGTGTTPELLSLLREEVDRL